MKCRIAVRGCGDIGSAVAQRLFVAGAGVIIHDSPQPTVTRRGMAFADALFDGTASLCGVTARRFDDLATLLDSASAHDELPVVSGDFATLLATAAPDVLVDARMRKRATPHGHDLGQISVASRRS